MAKSRLHAGAAEVDITPPPGLEMCGYGPYQKRLGMEVLDPLFARALWLRAGDEQIAMVAVDVCFVDKAHHAAVAERLRKRLGLDPGRLLLAASHTHSGPSLVPLIGWGTPDDGYVSTFLDRCVDAAAAAHDGLEPAAIGFDWAHVVKVGENREHTRVGPTDPAAQLFRVDAEDGRVIAVGYNYAAHPVVRYPFTARLSGDWPGQVAATLQGAFPGAVPIFLQGAAANINGHFVDFHVDDTDRRQRGCDARVGEVARRFLDQTLPAIKAIETKPDVALTGHIETIDLPFQTVDTAALEAVIEENLAVAERMAEGDLPPLHERIPGEAEDVASWRRARWTVDVSRAQLEVMKNPPASEASAVQLLRIGPAAIVSWPGEVFVELGIELRERSEVPMTLIAGYSNDGVGYIPTPWAYEAQGRPHQFGVYPTYQTPKIFGKLPYREDVGRLLVEKTLDMIRASVKETG